MEEDEREFGFAVPCSVLSTAGLTEIPLDSVDLQRGVGEVYLLLARIALSSGVLSQADSLERAYVLDNGDLMLNIPGQEFGAVVPRNFWWPVARA